MLWMINIMYKMIANQGKREVGSRQSSIPTESKKLKGLQDQTRPKRPVWNLCS